MNLLMRNRGLSARIGGLVLLAALAWLLPYGLDGYGIHVVNIAIVFALLAVGMGIAMGVAGQINLAQIAFFGVGSYALAIFTTVSGLGFWVSGVLAVIATAAAGLVVGIPALRVQSHYLGIVTLGLALAFTNWVTNAHIAGGAAGINGIPVPPLFGIDLTNEYLYYYVELVVFALAVAFAVFVVRTALGRRLRAMRDDSVAAGAVGAPVPVLRMTAFLVSSVYGGVAGVLYAGLIRYIAPETFSVANMFLLLAMVIIGGRQSIPGCIVGAVALSLVREALTDFSIYAQLGYGAVVVLMVVFAPAGLAGLPSRVRKALRRRKPADRAVLGPFLPYPPAGGDRSGASLEISGITKQFRGLKALKGVTLSVRAGEIRGIVGPNGSGKTTLFNVISGLYTATSGTAAIGQLPLTGRRTYQLSRSGLSRTFQNLRLFDQLTVEENLLVALDRSSIRSLWHYVVWPVGVWRTERTLRRGAHELLARFGLEDFADAAPRSLPYGIQRRVELARAMAADPKVLLLDEPAAGLNGQEVGQLKEIVRSIRDSGVTVVLIEHNMSLVMSLCDRVTVLAGGDVIAEGTPAEVAIRPEVIEAYLGDSFSTADVVHAVETEVMP
ncbi:branched-chain amino acid ABC transporter ATP-binding protein/permease [Amycolatopsis rhabdoformis]|uniref:Branched-chain amino acid ABC transporter ATP-binding protein/permease n=1 Tax=Amycolatopsis rhabdoformis TaxID=1448059 RepID=A0ABZ1IEN9_9PSEU|nr:branched-chain amino acid ABC transporter ATP-binding protein/permease [Amycolatopsis rhabdoformis]WSE32153.1 branched-chain amino acid ABC transporter ATP-binding protein/permease [Amycolatopsis rhabdoformis]